MKIKGIFVLVLGMLLVLLPLLVFLGQEDAASPSHEHSGVPPKLQEDQVVIYDEGSGQTLTLPLKEYLRGALCTEMPHTFSLEALKAQVVCIHSYLLYCQNMNDESENPANDLVDLMVNSQNWEGYVSEEQARARLGDSFDTAWGLLTQAVEEAGDLVLTYQGEPALTVYCSMSNGRTEESQNLWQQALPYLTSVESPGDLLAEGYESSVSFSQQEVQQILKSAVADANLGEDPQGWIQVTERSPAGYVTKVQVGEKEVSGAQIRSAFGLRSSSFLLEWKEDRLEFQVLGYGHGIGLSQYGAQYMAQQGSSFQEILAHYFQGTTLESYPS